MRRTGRRVGSAATAEDAPLPIQEAHRDRARFQWLGPDQATGPHDGGGPRHRHNRRRRDRYLRGSDHISFLQQAYPAARFTEPRENFDHEHQNITSSVWTEALPVGDVTTVTLPIAKDNVQIGLRAVDANGLRSPVAFPAVG